MDNLEKVKNGDMDGMRRAGGLNLLKNAANNVLASGAISPDLRQIPYQPRKFVFKTNFSS